MSKKYTIMLIEDESLFVEAVVKASENYDEFEIIATTDQVNTALDLLKSERPDVLIVDIQLPDGSGLSLMRQIKSSTEFADYNPNLIAITSYTSQLIMQQLKELVDDIHIKNIDFDVNEIFIRLQYTIQSVESHKITDLFPLSHNEQKMEEKISETLKSLFDTPPKRERHHRAAVKMIALALELHHLESLKLKDLYAKVAPLVHLKSGNSVKSLMTRYLDDIIKTTDGATLRHLFKSCHDPECPTAKEFFVILAQKVKSQLNL